MFKNTLDNKRYYTLNYYYKKTYGSKVFKVALNGGFSCPNKDGKKEQVDVYIALHLDRVTLLVI